MCPIVSACGTVTYNTDKFITEFFNITRARLHPLLKLVQILIHKIKHFSINPEEETLVLYVSGCFSFCLNNIALNFLINRTHFD